MKVKMAHNDIIFPLHVNTSQAQEGFLPMSTNKPIIVSVILTIVLLLAIAAVTMFSQIVMLNGVMNDRQATTALGVTLGCQGVTLLLGALFARWLTKMLITRFAWKSALAVIGTVTAVAVLGGAAFFVSMLAGLIAAGL